MPQLKTYGQLQSTCLFFFLKKKKFHNTEDVLPYYTSSSFLPPYLLSKMLSDLQNSQYCIKMSLVQMFLVKRLSPGGETVSFAAGSPAAADTELYANPS